jgi:hypothetical protein
MLKSCARSRRGRCPTNNGGLRNSAGSSSGDFYAPAISAVRQGLLAEDVAAVRAERDEGVAQLPRRPGVGVDPRARRMAARKSRRTSAASRGVPCRVVKTSPRSTHFSPASACVLACSRLCAERTSTQRAGSARVLVSPEARTERHTAMDGGAGRVRSDRPSRSTSDQSSARSSSVLAPVNTETTTWRASCCPQRLRGSQRLGPACVTWTAGKVGVSTTPTGCPPVIPLVVRLTACAQPRRRRVGR